MSLQYRIFSVMGNKSITKPNKKKLCRADDYIAVRRWFRSSRVNHGSGEC